MTERYSTVAIVLHWVIAIAIGSMMFLGENMKMADGTPIEWMYQLHKSIGITILVLTIARVLWRLMNPPPAPSDGLKAHEKALSHGVHIGFYALLILLPLTGWLLVSLSPFAIATVLFGAISWPHLPVLPGLALETREAWYPTAVNAHFILSRAMIVLWALHVIGAIKHEFGSEEGVLKRMIPGLFGKTAAPRAPSRGAISAFGASALFFGLVAGAPIAAQALNGSAAAPEATIANQNWTVDTDDSFIRFEGTYNGAPFSGSFDKWSAAIAYDPANPEAVEASVSVETGSANTGEQLYDSTISQTEWFDVGQFPSATVTVSGAEIGQDGSFTSNATLSIKGVDVPVAIDYTLSEDGDAVIMAGTATLLRTALNLGLSTDPQGTTVGNEVAVSIRVRAIPQES